MFDFLNSLFDGNNNDNKLFPSRLDGKSLGDRDPEFIKSAAMPIWEWFYHNYFWVKSDGWERIPPDGQMLFVGSHNGGLAAPDMHMAMYEWFRRFGTDRPVYGLMHPLAFKGFGIIAESAARCGAVVAEPSMAFAAFESDASVLVYPGGGEDAFRPHRLRDRIYFAGRKGFIKLALRAEVPIVPVVSWGAHDTLFVLEDIYPLMQQLHEWGLPWLSGLDPEVFPIYLGLPWGLAIGPLPNLPLPFPIRIRVCQPIVFERYGRSAARDRDYVDACYDLVVSQMQEQLDLLIINN